MRHVFGSMYECMHQFAAQRYNGDYGSAGNVSYRDGIAYSYDWYAIACIIDDKRALIQARNYSLSTGNHISAAVSALYPRRMLYVPVVNITCDCDHEENIAYFRKRYEEYEQRNKRSLKYCYVPKMILTLRDAREYCKWFRCTSRMPYTLRKWLQTPVSDLDALLAAKRKEIADREARLRSPEYQAKREARREARERANARKYAQTIERFRSGELRTLNRDVSWYALLRLNRDRTRIETSLGAQVLVSSAVKLWPLVERSYREQAVYTFPPRVLENSIRIDHYYLQAINSGEMHIGCHVIPYAEMERIAQELDLKGGNENHETDETHNRDR